MVARSGTIDEKEVGEVTNLEEVIRVMPPERIIELLGPARCVQALGLEKLAQSLSTEQFDALVRLRGEQQAKTDPPIEPRAVAPSQPDEMISLYQLPWP